MKSFSNTYIFIFSTVMVIIVAAILSFAAMSLKPYQDKNIEIEKKKNILASINISSTQLDAEVKYEKHITSSYVIDGKGDIIENPVVEAFEIDMRKEFKKDIEYINLPLFVNETSEGDINYIVPIRGKGLWGPIWGYIALKSDYNTIYGVTFSHAKETPGLGAEIATIIFQEQFKDKKVFNASGKFQSIKIVKGGADPSSNNEVDAVSGGTITSNALQETIDQCMSFYIPYFEKVK